MKITTPLPTDSLDTFLGSSERDSDTFDVKCLYRRQIPQGIRTKFGISADTAAIVYLSPIELQDVLGTEILNDRQTTVILFGVEYAIFKLVYLEPLYETYVSAMLELQAVVKGG